MPGALLRDDWQRAVEDELRKYAQGITQTAQSAVQVVQGVPRPDPNQVMDELQVFAGGLMQQPAQQAQQGVIQLQQNAQDVNAQLQSYAQGLFPAAPPQPTQQQGVIQLQQPTPPQPQEPEFAQPAAPVRPLQAGQPSGRIPAEINVPIDQGPSISREQTRAALAGTALAGYGDVIYDLGQRYNVDPAFALSVARNESNYGASPAQSRNNNIFSISNALYGGSPVAGSRWGQYPTKEAGIEAFFKLLTTEYYPKGQTTVGSVMWGPEGSQQHAYAPTSENSPDYPNRLIRTMQGYGSAASATAPRDPNVALAHSEEPASATDAVGDKWKTQFDFKATYTGDYRTGTPHRGIDLVPQRGGIGTSIEAFQPGVVTQISRDTGGAGGLMVYVRDRDGLTHAYMHLQAARPGLKVGDIINRGDTIATMGESGTEGSPHLHYEVRRSLDGDPLNALIDPRPYMRGVGGTAPRTTREAAQPDQPWQTVIAGGDQQKVRQPIYLQQNQPSAIQTVGGAIEDTRQRVGGFFEDVGRGARQVQQEVEPARAWLAGESQAGARAQGYSPAFQEQARQIAQAQPQQPTELTPGAVAGNAWRMLIENPSTTGIGGIQLDDYMRLEGQKNDWIEQNNPAKQLTTMGVPVVEGLTTMVAQQLTSPLVVASFGPTVGLGVRGGAAATEALLSRGAAEWVANVAGKFTAGAITNGLQNAIFEASQPGADPGKVGMAIILGAGLGGAIDAGAPAVKAAARYIGREVSDAVRDQATRDMLTRFATEPQRGEAEVNFALGGVPGAVERIRGRGAAEAVTPPAQEAVPAAPPTVPPVPPPAEIPPPAPPVPRRVTGRQRLPNYQPGTPEAEFEAIARPLRESSPDGLLHLDLNTLPKDILPLDRNAAAGSGIVKANPGGMPHTDDLRALLEANEQKRDFYFDQSDQGVPTVGPDNLEEWFAVNAIMSQRTGVTTQVREAIDMMGTVRKVAQDGRAAGKSPQEIRADILKAVNDFAYAGPSGPNKRIGANRGYATGVSETGGIKTPTFAGNYGSAESRLYDPGITNDMHNWRALNVDSFGTGEKDAANNPTLYRTVEAIWNELGAEQGMDGYAAQSSIWDGIRAMQTRTPEAWAKWQAGDFKGAIAEAKAAGAFNRMTQTAGAPEPGEISRAMNAPGVKAALAKWGSILKEPLPPELGINSVVRTYPGEVSAKGIPKRGAAPLRPASLPFREGERAVAEAEAPIVRGISGDVLERLSVDERGVMPWLAASHRVVEETPGSYAVHLHAGNVDTARYVASEIGSALGAPEMRIHYPDYRVDDVAGFKFVGDGAEVRRIQDALDAEGLPTIRGTTGRSLQIPLYDEDVATRVVQTLQRNGIDPNVLPQYNGGNELIPADAYPRHLEETRGRFEPTTAGRRDLLERARGVPAEAGAGFTAPGGAEPPAGGIGGLRRARGEAELPFSFNLGGAALGGWSGYAATPEGSEWSEYARNVGIGATAGLLGTAAITHGGGGRRLATAAARAGEGFRAPGGPPGPVRGADILEARVRGPRDIPEPGEPGSLGEVHSNPHLLRKAGPDETPLTDDELVAHYDALEERMAEIKSRAAAVDEVLRNPIQKPLRPPWAAGYTNDALVELARRHNISPYQEAWWDTVGLSSGSGEVRYDVGESGLRGTGRVEPTPTELRAERNALAQEERDLLAAADQLGNATPEDRWVRRPIRGEAVESGDLPFDAGRQEAAPSGPYATEQAGPSGNLAEDLVTRNGTVKPRDPLGPPPGLSEDAAGVVGRGEVKGRDVIGRGITDPTAVPEPSARARKVMPNLDAMLGDNMPEVRAQIEQSVNDNIELYEAYQQGRISHDSLVHDLATKVGMSKKDFLATPVGKGFNTAETVALQAAAIESQVQQRALAASIEAAGGVEALTPEQVAWGLSSLLDAARLTAVASGARSTAGRTLNALKIRVDAAMSKAISASNEVISATRLKDQARRGEARAKKLLEQAKETDAERATVAKAAQAAAEADHPSARGKTNVWQQIDDAYNDLDRYQAMSLHEKADDFDRLARERAERAAARKAKVREAPEELLSALKAELKAERDIFAGRKDTWESMAFWDSKAGEIAAQKRADFRGGLYIEQQRRAANEALKQAEADYARAWKAESGRQTRQTERATMLLERIGGMEPSKELLDQFVKAINSGDDLAAAKFLKGMQDPGWWGKATILRLAGLLSSTATHMANAVGNVSQVPLEVVSHGLTVGIDWARAARTGGERQAYWAELGPMLEAYGPGFLAAMPDFARVMRTGITASDMTDLSRIRAGFRSGSERVDTIVEAPLRLLSASDALFRGGAFAMHANRVATRYAIGEGFGGAARKGRAADIVAHLEEYPELYQEAYDAAARMVFQEKRTVPMPGVMAKGVPGAIMRGGVAQVLPFIKTPANITAQGFGLTPLGFLGVGEAIANRPNVAAARMGRQTLLAEERAARAAVGTMIMGGFMALGAGTLTGGKSMLTAGYPTDSGEASTLPPGWREWSLRVEDGVTGNVHYVPFQNFGAAGVPMAMASLLTDSAKRHRGLLDADEMTRAVTGIGGYVLDNTFLQGLSDTNDVLHDPERYAPRFVEGLIASYGPYSAMGRQIQRAYGVAARNPREGFQGMVDALISSYPGVSGMVPEATTALGEPRSMGVSGIGAFASPVRSSLEVDEPTLRVLRENDVNIAAPSKSISIGKGQEIELTEAEQDQLKRARGVAIRRNVAAAQQTEGWRRATEVTTRNAILRHAMQAAQESSKLEFFKTLSTAEVEARRKAARELEPTYIGGAP